MIVSKRHHLSQRMMNVPQWPIQNLLSSEYPYPKCSSLLVSDFCTNTIAVFITFLYRSGVLLMILQYSADRFLAQERMATLLCFKQVIFAEAVCDGSMHCEDFSDECLCSRQTVPDKICNILYEPNTAASLHCGIDQGA